MSICIDTENWFNIASAKREFSWNFYQIAFDYLVRLSSRSIKELNFFQIALFRSACSDRDTRACINHKFTLKCIKISCRAHTAVRILRYKSYVQNKVAKLKVYAKVSSPSYLHKNLESKVIVGEIYCQRTPNSVSSEKRGEIWEKCHRKKLFFFSQNTR